jgi:hypothetical protein
MTTKNMYKCNICNYVSNNKSNVNRHILNKHKSDSDSDSHSDSNLDTKTEIKPEIKSETKIETKPEIKNYDKNIYLCDKCNKKYKTKKHFDNHYIKCLGIDILTCPKCMTKFSSTSSKSNHIKKNNCKSINNYATNTNNYIYLLQEREFVKNNEHIYKIGKTKQEKLKRYNKYPKGSHLLLHISCFDCDIIEKTILSIFKEKFIHKKDIGYEYFEGNYIDMMRIITNIILNNCQSFKNK